MSDPQRLEELLPWLSVVHTNKKKYLLKGPAINDDTYEPLTCTWYNNLVRIATIGDGSCFIHAVLKGFFKEYQEAKSAELRFNIARNIRRDLAIALGLENQEYPGHTYWETANKGSFPRILMQELIDEELIEILGIDYSIHGLERLFNSFKELGDEVYGFVSDVLNVDIYVLRATPDDLYPHVSTKEVGVVRNAVVIIGNKYHYEVLAVDTENGLQTLFSPDDPFVQTLNYIFVGNRELNEEEYDPDTAFIANIMDIFVINNKLIIPNIMYERLSDNDPFRMQLERLWDRIQQMAEIYGIEMD
jgi:hypothetical protein